jgi:hypothetical protein
MADGNAIYRNCKNNSMSFAAEMLRGCFSLPALKELLGHKDIHLTMPYVQVAQNDLQKQDRLAVVDCHRSCAISMPSMSRVDTPQLRHGHSFMGVFRSKGP